MAIVPPPPPDGSQPNGSPFSQQRGLQPQLPTLSGRGLLLLLLFLLPVAVLCYVWFVMRVEVPTGKVLTLVRKVGRTLPAEAAGQVVLYPALLKKLGEPEDSTAYKGIVYGVKPEGRYFYDPFFWERSLEPATFIGQDEIGVLVRKYGKSLPSGKIVATKPDERGPLAEYLRQGRHNINPHAYDVKRYKQIQIPKGSVGVQTLRAGLEPENANRYVVNEGERGVQPAVLPPGLYFMNPYLWRVDLIDTRSHTLDLRNKDAIHFPAKDSFNIVIEGTVEYAIRQDMAPYVMAAIGDHGDIIGKLIIPYMKSFARIEGSKLEAREFISGDTRKAFQDRVLEGLRTRCLEQGIEIRAVLMRRIEPPAEIANPISDRQVATQKITQYENEIRLADSQAQLVQQEELQKQNQDIGQANREVVAITIDAEQRKSVALTEANKRLEVVKLTLEAARETAEAMLSRGQAEAEVVRLNYQAEAEPLRQAVSAFGGGESYAQYFFYQKLGPAVKSVLASTEGPFADIFRNLSAAADSRAKAPKPE